MMMYVLNSFQEEHADEIDKPMTRSLADTIKAREQEKLDALVAVGALIGEPVVEFSPLEEAREFRVENDPDADAAEQVQHVTSGLLDSRILGIPGR